MDGDQGEGDLKLRLRDVGAYLISLSEGGQLEANEEYVRFAPPTKMLRMVRHEDDTPRLRKIAIGEYRRRRARAEFFDSGLFSEPAWDILLDLFVAAIDGIRVSITSACIASSCAPTTALRWISVLESQGLVVRSGDPRDQRRSWLTLTEKGHQRMCSYLRGKQVTHHEFEISSQR
jgi:hypothetical protein